MSYGRGSRSAAGPGQHGATAQSGRSEQIVGKRTLVEMAFPHAAAIKTSLGTSIPGSAVHDPVGCEERGVAAFTDGSVTSFASESPALHVAAHEAVHQLQHAGMTHDGGMGAERHAHEVAEVTAAGGDARDLLSGEGARVEPGVRNYTEMSVADQTARSQWVIGSAARVSQTGKVVTSVTDRHVCFAEPQLIADANLILRAKRSAVELSPGPAGPSGDAPDGSGPKSTVWVVTNVSSEHSGNNYADCGRMSREVQGGAGTDSPSRGVYRDSGGAERETPTASHSPQAIRDEVLVATGLGATPAAARAAYLAMTSAQRDAFDRQHRINRYAAPNVGESYASARDDASTMDKHAKRPLVLRHVRPTDEPWTDVARSVGGRWRARGRRRRSPGHEQHDAEHAHLSGPIAMDTRCVVDDDAGANPAVRLD